MQFPIGDNLFSADCDYDFWYYVGFIVLIMTSWHMSTIHPESYIYNLFIYDLSFND